ncbi:MAG: LmbE family protein, partial [bacterium]|nr:LmbE family protein [bacterium]
MLSDIVWVIRKVRPDIIVLRFSGTSRDGHGHHRSSAMLGKEAFRAAADPGRFPEQLRHVEPWQAKRIFWNVFSFRRGGFTNEGDMAERLDVDAGEYSPLLGFSYAEIAGMSRSMHRSQGFGAPLRKGPSVNSLLLVDGEPAKSDPLDGVDTTWNRVADGATVGKTLARASESFDAEHPEKVVPLLREARRQMARLTGSDVSLKQAELDEAIALATGLWLDAAAERSAATPGSRLKVEVTALNRSPYPLELVSVELDGAGVDTAAAKLGNNQPVRKSLEWDVPADQPYSEPYWLREEKDGNRYHIA